MKQHKVLLVAGASPNYQWLLGMCPCLEETSLAAHFLPSQLLNFEVHPGFATGF